MARSLELTGQTFGRLHVIERAGSRNSKALWLCECECGKTAEAISNDLVSGKVRSCGCLWREVIRRDLVGSIFGRLTVLGDSGKRGAGRGILWNCQCECGSVKAIRGRALLDGMTISCGCYHRERVSGTNCSLYKDGRWADPNYQRLVNRQREARRRGAMVDDLDPRDVTRKMEEWGNQCVYCGQAFEQIDHLIPISRGGQHSLENLLPSCSGCNNSKNSRYLGSEWWPRAWPPMVLDEG